MANLDSAKVAGLIVIGAVLVLSAMRRGFAGVSVHVGS
jgi:hypothetical protein